MEGSTSSMKPVLGLRPSPAVILPPLARVSKSKFEAALDARGAKEELRETDYRLARLSSQHASSEYNQSRKRLTTSQRPALAASTVSHRRPLSFTPRSTLVESPPKPTLSLSTPTKPGTLYEDEPESDTTPTAKRPYIGGPDSAVQPERRLDLSGLAMREVPFPSDTAPPTPTHLPKGTKTSVTHPINLSPIVPPELLSTFGFYLLGPPPDEHSPSALPHFAPSSPPRRGLAARSESPTRRERPPPAPRVVKPVLEAYHLVQHPRNPGHAPLDLCFLTKPGQEEDIFSPWTTPLASATLPRSAMQQPPLDGGPGAIGNLLLSSCPGKKVRLFGNEHLGGRSAICRDLRMDLQAARDAGARGIVCCLDNEELAMLGAPWSEYFAIANELGLAIHRLPMVEGAGPVGGSSVLDATLEVILSKHTLRGESVLVHCRGGVGRAGLVACGWMLKMHLIGGGSAMPALTLVERCVEVIRRRRSIKAIETPAQVKALLDYIVFLRTCKGVRAEEVLAKPML